MIETTRNWAGNITYSAARLHYPETVAQVRHLVTQHRKLKVQGARHSFTDIADSPEDLISLDHFEPTVAVDAIHRTVTISGSVRYEQLCAGLHQAGFALHNMASLPHVSVAGACATGTHGSGVGNGNLATAVAAMEVVTGTGDVVVFSREQHGEQFHGAVIGLGGLGIVTRLTLDIQPTFDMRQDVYENLPLAQVVDHFDPIFSGAYSVSLFTDWRGPRFNQVWLKRRVTDTAAREAPPVWFEATRATRQHDPVGDAAEDCTGQLGVPGPWHERLPHFRMAYMPERGQELQSEYMVPRQHAVAALQALDRLRDHVAPHLQMSEIRTIAADSLWMSPCYQQASIALHFTWKPDWPAVSQLLPTIEEELTPLGARPHWGKLFTMPAARVQSLYAKLPDFQQLLRNHDPQGKFRNRFLDTYIFGTG
ncbi:MAG: D-arabinono-1,4-lactone oxidase [Casimicrobiaceae bacterium]